MNNCKRLIDDQLRQLNLKFKGKYINNIVLKDTIFKPENIIQIDDYIRFMFNDDTLKLPTAKLIISGSIHSDLLYNRNYTDSNFAQLQKGYYYPIRITCNFDYSYKITEKWREETLHSFPEKHPFFYELLIMRLDNGEIWLLTEDYEFRLIRYSASLEREDFMLYKYFPEGCKNVTIMGSEREMGHRFIHDYIQSFRNLETILIDRLNSECPELVSLIRNFRRILDKNFTKYSKYYDLYRTNLIMGLVSVETRKRRSKLSKFAKVNKRGRAMGKLQLIELEKRGVFDIKLHSDELLQIILKDDFEENYIDYFQRIEKLLYLDDEHILENIIIIFRTLRLYLDAIGKPTRYRKHVMNMYESVTNDTNLGDISLSEYMIYVFSVTVDGEAYYYYPIGKYPYFIQIIRYMTSKGFIVYDFDQLWDVPVQNKLQKFEEFYVDILYMWLSTGNRDLYTYIISDGIYWNCENELKI